MKRELGMVKGGRTQALIDEYYEHILHMALWVEYMCFGGKCIV